MTNLYEVECMPLNNYSKYLINVQLKLINTFLNINIIAAKY